MALPEFKKNTFDFKGLFLLKFGANKQSMAWDERGHEDGLKFPKSDSIISLLTSKGREVNFF